MNSEAAILAMLEAMNGKIDTLAGKQDAMGQRLDAMEHKLDTVIARQDAMEQRLDALAANQEEMQRTLNAVMGQTAGLTEFKTRIKAEITDLHAVVRQNCYEIARLKAAQ